MEIQNWHAQYRMECISSSNNYLYTEKIISIHLSRHLHGSHVINSRIKDSDTKQNTKISYSFYSFTPNWYIFWILVKSLKSLVM